MNIIVDVQSTFANSNHLKIKKNHSLKFLYLTYLMSNSSLIIYDIVYDNKFKQSTFKIGVNVANNIFKRLFTSHITYQ